MLIIFCAALVFTVGRCTDDQHFATKTVSVGEEVTLTCIRRSKPVGLLFWKRVVAGNFPEVLGATYTFDHPAINQTPHFTAKQENGTYVLHIAQTKLSDTAFYYCEEIIELKTTLNVTLLTVKGPEPDITAVVQVSPSDPVRPGDSVSLQCSVLYDSENQMCSEGHSVYWFRAGSDESHPSVIHVHRNRGDECESPEDHAPQKCVYNFISSSDAGKYHCAVATCGQILFGKETKQEINADSVWPFDASQRIAVFLQCAVLAVSLIVLAVFIYAVKKGECESLNALHTNAAAVSADLYKQIAEETQTYSAVIFTMMKTRGDGKKAKPVDRRKIDAVDKTFRNNERSSMQRIH